MIRHCFVSYVSFDSFVTPSTVLNVCKWEFNESSAPLFLGMFGIGSDQENVGLLLYQ